MFLRHLFLALLWFGSVSALAAVDPLPAPRLDFRTAGIVNVIAKDSENRIWLGGDFLEVDGQARSNIVRLLPDGSVDPSFNCNIDGSVRALVFDADNRVYVGGQFQYINGQEKLYLARISSDCELDTSFPASPAPNSTVNALAFNGAGDALFVGGTMSQPTQRLVRYATATGLIAPGFGFTIPVNLLALASDGAEGVYVGGSFASVNGQTTYARLAHLQYDVVNGTSSINTNFAAAPDNTVFTLMVTADSVFAGGAFSQIAGNSRSRLARLLRSDGSLVTGFQPAPNGPVRALAPFGGSELLVAGGFNAIGGRQTGSVARIARATGDAALTNADSDAPILSMYVDTSVAHVGGTSSLLGGQSRAGYGAFDFANGGSLVAAADAVVLSTGGAYSHWRDTDGSLWVGGSFLRVNGLPIAGLARLTPSNQIDTAVNLNLRGRRAVFNMARDNQGRLYFGGELEQIGGQARNGIGRLLANNTLDNSFAFKLSPRTGQNDVTVFKILIDGDFLYVLGDFAAIEDPNGQTALRSSVAKINLLNNTVVSTWAPVIDFQTPDELALQAIAIDSISRRLYIGGRLTAVDGTPRSRLAAIHLDTGQLIAGFAPGIEGANADIWELALDQAADRLYVGGASMTGVDGVSGFGPFFRLVASTGVLDQTWNAGFSSSGTIETIALDDQNHVYIGGSLPRPPQYREGLGVYKLNRDAMSPRYDLDFTPEAAFPYQISFSPAQRTLTFTGVFVRSKNTIWTGLAVLPEQGYLFRDGLEDP